MLIAYTQPVDLPEQDVRRLIVSLGVLPSPRSRPALIVLCGLPGSGKSTIAHELARLVDVAVVRSDAVRRLLAPAPDYTTAESRRVFAAIETAVEQVLQAGVPVLVDATNIEAWQRQPFAAIAERTGARLHFVWVSAREHTIRRRLAAREAGQRGAYDVSDAGVDVYAAMKARAEPIRGPHWTVYTDHDYTGMLTQLARVAAPPDIEPTVRTPLGEQR